jgi:hypothetical protein
MKRKASAVAVIHWIDDDFSGTKSQSDGTVALMRNNNRIEVQTYHPLVAADRLAQSTSRPDLFLVDYRLSKKALDGALYIGAGTSIAGLIRDRLPEHPIYLTSALLTDEPWTCL